MPLRYVIRNKLSRIKNSTISQFFDSKENINPCEMHFQTVIWCVWVGVRTIAPPSPPPPLGLWLWLGLGAIVLEPFGWQGTVDCEYLSMRNLFSKSLIMYLGWAELLIGDHWSTQGNWTCSRFRLYNVSLIKNCSDIR